MRYQLAVYLLLIGVLANAYSDYSFKAVVKIDGEGAAHVTEKTVLLFENQLERKAFEDNMNLGESTIVEWRKFSENIKYHFKGGISNIKITAKREFDVSFDAGTIILEYDVVPLFDQVKVGSRRTVYTLLPDSLSFQRTGTGQISLGNNVELVFEYPSDAELLKADPIYDENDRQIVWRGPLTGNWEFQFAREIPLSQEVSEFFVETYLRATKSLPLLLLSAFSLLVLFVLLKFRGK